MTGIDITTLEASLEALIRQQVAAYEASLREALGRKLTSGRGGSSRRTVSTVPKPKRGQRSPLTPRRTPEELEALGDRFFKAVEKTPGEPMRALAASLGLRSQELERPVALLKKAGRIRMVGERSRARYYPMTPRPA